MTGLVFIGIILLLGGILVSIILLNFLESLKAGTLVLAGSILTAACIWTLAWAYDDFNEMAIRWSHKNVKIIAISESDIDKFKIDIKELKPIYVKICHVCGIHYEHMIYCNKACFENQQPIKIYKLILADDNVSKFDEYEKLIEQEKLTR